VLEIKLQKLKKVNLKLFGTTVVKTSVGFLLQEASNFDEDDQTFFLIIFCQHLHFHLLVVFSKFSAAPQKTVHQTD